MTNQSVCICVIGRNKLFRTALKTLFGNETFKITMEADSMEDVAPVSEGHHNGRKIADIILFDIHDDSDELIGDLNHIQHHFPGTPILVMSETVKIKTLRTCFDNGVSGYLTKDISLDALQYSLQLIVLGEKVFPTYTADILINGSMSWAPSTPTDTLENATNLSSREREILRYLINGDSNKMIAIRLNITESTVKVHMKSLLKKIQATNRTQAAIWALKNGVIETGPQVTN